MRQVIEGPFRGTVVNCVPSGAGPGPKQPQAKKKGVREGLGPAGVLAFDGPLPPELAQARKTCCPHFSRRSRAAVITHAWCALFVLEGVANLTFGMAHALCGHWWEQTALPGFMDLPCFRGSEAWRIRPTRRTAASSTEGHGAA